MLATSSTTAAKKEKLSSFAPWCAQTRISTSAGEGKKPHQGVAAQNLTPFLGQELSKSRTALGLALWAGKTASGPAVAANNGKPPCSSNKTYSIPQQWQNAALRNYGWTVASVTLTANGDIAGLQIANLRPLNFQGLQLPGNSRMTVQTAPGGFAVNVSGSPGYLGLPTGSWYSAGVNYVQFSNGQFTNVNGQAATISGSSWLGSLLGINSGIQSTLNGNPDAISGANALSSALGNCTF